VNHRRHSVRKDSRQAGKVARQVALGPKDVVVLVFALTMSTATKIRSPKMFTALNCTLRGESATRDFEIHIAAISGNVEGQHSGAIS
jgi:hypothetical protein